MRFEDFLLEGKRFAFSKDGVRKEVKTDREAEAWKQTIAKQPKQKHPMQVRGSDLLGKSSEKPQYNYHRIGRIIEDQVGAHFPDSEGWDAIAKEVRKLYPHLTMDTVGDVINAAAKKELHVGDFWDYVERFHRDNAHLIPKDH